MSQSCIVYLDYNATAPLRPEAVTAMVDSFKVLGNPSSVHAPGRAVRHTLEEARRTIAQCLGARPEWVIFTSGGTEANMLALSGASRILTTPIEHDCILAAARRLDPDVMMAPVDATGYINLESYDQHLTRLADAPDTGKKIISVMLANNETGCLQPVQDMAARARQYGIRIHCDAVQAVGKVPVDMDALGVDSLSISAHKFGGPKGIGALIHRSPADIYPLLLGGAQERRRRAGTENITGITGMAAALSAAVNTLPVMKQVQNLRDMLQTRLVSQASDAVVYADACPRLANTLCLGLPGVGQDMQVMQLDLMGVSVSAGAACSSGKLLPSHVLLAMGTTPDAAREAIRFSLGWLTTPQDIDAAVTAWTSIAQKRQ